MNGSAGTPSGPSGREDGPLSIPEIRLAVTLEAAVPLWIARLKADGGPTEETFERCRAWTEDLCGPGGEDLLFKSKKPGQSAARFNDLAYCLAVMAFCPGGVTFLGKHWEAPPLITLIF